MTQPVDYNDMAHLILADTVETIANKQPIIADALKEFLQTLVGIMEETPEDARPKLVESSDEDMAEMLDDYIQDLCIENCTTVCRTISAYVVSLHTENPKDPISVGQHVIELIAHVINEFTDYGDKFDDDEYIKVTLPVINITIDILNKHSDDLIRDTTKNLELSRSPE